MAAKTFEEYWDDNHISEGYREMYKACWKAATKAAEERFTYAQHTQPAMCLGCEYWRMPSGGHCMRGEGVEYCYKVGTHAGVR